MIPDRYIWAAALAMVKRYGDDAMLEAAERADQLQGQYSEATLQGRLNK